MLFRPTVTGLLSAPLKATPNRKSFQMLVNCQISVTIMMGVDMGTTMRQKMRQKRFWRIFWRIVVPMSTPIMMVTLIWQFTNIWNDFLFGVAFSGADSKPVTVGLNNMANTTSSVKNYNVDMAAAIIAGLPTMLVYVLAGQYFVKGLTAGAVKG